MKTNIETIIDTPPAANIAIAEQRLSLSREKTDDNRVLHVNGVYSVSRDSPATENRLQKWKANVCLYEYEVKY